MEYTELAPIIAIYNVLILLIINIVIHARSWWKYRYPRSLKEEQKKRKARFMCILYSIALVVHIIIILIYTICTQSNTIEDSIQLSVTSKSDVVTTTSVEQEVTRRYRGGTYFGSVNSVTNSPDGKGKMIYNNGDVYEGEWINGAREGFGRMTYNNGDIYEGEWINDKRDGQGTYTWKAGGEYTGAYKDDMRDGEGTYNGWEGYRQNYGWIGTYQGTSRKDMFEGDGSFEFNNGDRFEGTFSQNRMWTGVYIRKDGSRYWITEGVEYK